MPEPDPSSATLLVLGVASLCLPPPDREAPPTQCHWQRLPHERRRRIRSPHVCGHRVRPPRTRKPTGSDLPCASWISRHGRRPLELYLAHRRGKSEGDEEVKREMGIWGEVYLPHGCRRCCPPNLEGTKQIEVVKGPCLVLIIECQPR
jgi:hypothetical protein